MDVLPCSFGSEIGAKLARRFRGAQPEFVSIGSRNQPLIICRVEEGVSALDMTMITGVDFPGSGA